ncbi:hypothetical protein [Bacillus sp. 165]|uniref:hypothetical protein n=1 Tax=Bacillus sp. 165 TaxID=1529117 RepID=UPI001ADB77EC|nr:hypothetical protein [Bacillus sp. 165]MBO9129037.1 hypothetical protein [Bacillus sp. 165]
MTKRKEPRYIQLAHSPAPSSPERQLETADFVNIIRKNKYSKSKDAVIQNFERKINRLYGFDTSKRT